jgi:DNA polymerase III delta prime subunit
MDDSIQWFEKYAPKSLSEINGNEHIIEVLESYLTNNNIPNLIIEGPNGVGKTTACKLLVKSYLGEYYKTSCLQIYGAINRGKDVVSGKIDEKKGSDKGAGGPNIINFAKRELILPKNKCRIIVIYEFDKMTTEAQMALRRPIEIFNKTRFILICNDINNIIEAIHSRSVILKFNHLSNDDLSKILYGIAGKENMIVPDEVMNAICLNASGDIRLGINYLQILGKSNNISTDCFYKIFNMPSHHTISTIIEYCIRSEKCKAINLMKKLIENGYNTKDILDIFLKVTMKYPEISEKQRSRFIMSINKCFYNIETSNSNVHLYNLLANF